MKAFKRIIPNPGPESQPVTRTHPETTHQSQIFKCGSCGSVYADHYPVDDTCAVCRKGLIRLTGEAVNKHPFGPHDQSAEWRDSEKAQAGKNGIKPAHDGRVLHQRIRELSAQAKQSIPLQPVARGPVQLKQPAVLPLPGKGLERG